MDREEAASEAPLPQVQNVEPNHEVPQVAEEPQAPQDANANQQPIVEQVAEEPVAFQADIAAFDVDAPALLVGWAEFLVQGSDRNGTLISNRDDDAAVVSPDSDDVWQDQLEDGDEAADWGDEPLQNNDVDDTNWWQDGDGEIDENQPAVGGNDVDDDATWWQDGDGEVDENQPEYHGNMSDDANWWGHGYGEADWNQPEHHGDVDDEPHWFGDEDLVPNAEARSRSRSPVPRQVRRADHNGEPQTQLDDDEA